MNSSTKIIGLPPMSNSILKHENFRKNKSE